MTLTLDRRQFLTGVLGGGVATGLVRFTGLSSLLSMAEASAATVPEGVSTPSTDRRARSTSRPVAPVSSTRTPRVTAADRRAAFRVRPSTRRPAGL